MRHMIFALAICWVVVNGAYGDPTTYSPGMKCHDKASWTTCNLLFPGGCCYTDSVLRYATVPTTTLEVCSVGGPSDCCVIQVNTQYEVQCSGASAFRVLPGTTCGVDIYVVGFVSCESLKYRCRDATQAERNAGQCDPLTP